MTSLDFQGLLKQEKALLHQAERAKQRATSATSVTSATSTDDAAQPETTLKIRHQNDQYDPDGVVNSNDHPLSSPSGSPANDCRSEEPVDSEGCPSPCFEELAARPPLDPSKVIEYSRSTAVVIAPPQHRTLCSLVDHCRLLLLLLLPTLALEPYRYTPTPSCK